MTRRRILLIALLGIFPVLVSAVDSVGWWKWEVTRRHLRLGSELAVEDLRSSIWVGLPSFVERARKLPVTAFADAPRESVIEILARLGRFQVQWMPGGAAGFSQLALEKLLSDQPGQAIPLLEEAVLRDPHAPYIRRLRGLIFLLAGARDPALNEIAFAEAVAPGYRGPEIELTDEDQQLIRLRGLELRRDVYPRRQGETALALARLLRNKGENDGAWNVLNDLAGHPKIDLEIAKWKLESGDYLGALEILNAITSRKTLPRGLRAQAWSSVAVAQDELANPEGALDAAGEALRLDPDSPTPYLTLAHLSERRGDVETALEYLRRAWGMAPSDVNLLLRMARVAERAGKNAEATQALVRAVELAPDSPEIVMRLVEAQIRDGRYAEAAMSLSRGLDRFPTHSGLLNLADRLRRDIGIR